MRRACLYYELQNELFVRNRQAVALFLPTIYLVTTRLDYTCQLFTEITTPYVPNNIRLVALSSPQISDQRFQNFSLHSSMVS